MSIPIEIPGLDTIIPELGEGKVVVVESGADAAKSFFVRRLSLTAGRSGWPVTFVTSRDRDELQALLAAERGDTPMPQRWIQIQERDAVQGLEEFAESGGLLAIDSFSFLTLDLPPDALARSLRALRLQCRDRGTTAVLGTDRGMFEPRSEAVAIHLADGLLQFHTREAPEGVQRFLRIPKWMDGKFVDRNVYYEFDGKRIAIDLRSRVL
jgi:KaiC/GvpD/RAD55 family RecA-like ATPase